MAWSSEALATYETARLALDKPLIAAQVIPVSPAYAKWIDDAQFVGAGNLTTWTDRSGTTTPARWAYDGFPGYLSAQSGTSEDKWHYCIGLATAITFDCAFLVGGNWGTSTLVDDLVLKIADDNAYSSNLTEIGNFGQPTDDTRLADLNLNHGGDAQRYTAQFFDLVFDNTGGAFTPTLGELVLGRRRQLEWKALRPFDEYALSENAEFIDSESGVIQKIIYSRRGFRLNGDLHIDSDTYRDDLVSFFRQCRGSFVWVRQPNTAPESFNLMLRNGGLEIPEIDANLRQHRLTAMEQGPSEYYLDVEANG